MLSHIYFYAKAYYAALFTGVMYLTTVIGPDIQFSDLTHVSLLHWIGFIGAVLGVGAGVAGITNGDKPAAKATAKPAELSADVPAANPVASVSAPVVSAPEISASTTDPLAVAQASGASVDGL